MSNQSAPPPPMADLVGPVLKAGAIIAAGQLGMFKALAGGPCSITELAGAIGASDTGVAILAEALASVGYLERVDGRYANGPVPRTWLTPASQVDFTPGLLWMPLAWRLLEGLQEVIRRGGPERPLFAYLQEHPELGRTMAQYMKTQAQLIAGPVMEAVVVPQTARRLLDLGGAHGLYSIAFCQRHPLLHAVVFDLAVALADTGRAIAEAGLAERVHIQEGDYLADDIGEGYDVVLCFALFHNQTVDQNRRLLAKVARALKPGGLLAIAEILRGDPPDAFAGLYSLLFFLYSGTRTYGYDEITGWLAEAGFDECKRIDLPPPGPVALVTAVRPG